MSTRIRIGIVGAGSNTKARHIPGFKAQKDVEIVGVCNRSEESSKAVADEFGIPKVFSDWKSLVTDPEIDAVMIGTWPDMHCEITCAALEAGKHVLVEARMARNLEEARKMKAASDANPELVAQVVPSPFGLFCNSYVKNMLHHEFLGAEIREVVVIGANDIFRDFSKELHWRQDSNISGNNILAMGILHETLSRWAPKTTRVFAQTTTFENVCPAPNGEFGNADVTVPDSVQIVTQLEGGARGVYHLSGIDIHGPGHQIHMYGKSGTIKLKIDPEERLICGRLGADGLSEVEIPEDKMDRWRVEEEFIEAVRGNETVELTDFESALEYMEFTEAVHLSATSGMPVDLPLK